MCHRPTASRRGTAASKKPAGRSDTSNGRASGQAPRLRAPKGTGSATAFGLWPMAGRGASLDEIARLIGDALNLACMAPTTSRRQPPVALDDDLKGRHPDW